MCFWPSSLAIIFVFHARCFIAEGLDHGQELFLADPNGAKKLLAELPAKTLQQKSPDVSAKNATDVERESREEEERFRIAWRYQTQPMFDSTLGRNSDKMMADPDHAESKVDMQDPMNGKGLAGCCSWVRYSNLVQNFFDKT